MKNQIKNLGKVLSRTELKNISGGTTLPSGGIQSLVLSQCCRNSGFYCTACILAHLDATCASDATFVVC